MKRILFVLCAVLTVLCIFTAAVGAETATGELAPELVTETALDEATEVVTDAPSDTEAATEAVLPEASADESVSPTLFTRVWEYIVKYKSEILGIVGDGMILIGVMVLKGIFKKKTSDISSDIKGVRGDTSRAGAQQIAVVDAVNELIAGYNNMKKAYEKYETVEDDRNRLVGAVLAQNTAILDMLRTVYANNKNLPQGVKDVVMLEYANTKKALGDDELLRSVVDSVHEKVNAGTEVAASSEGKR